MLHILNQDDVGRGVASVFLIVPLNLRSSGPEYRGTFLSLIMVWANIVTGGHDIFGIKACYNARILILQY